MSLPNPLTSRRTAMTAGLAGLLAVSGCAEGAGDAQPAADPTTDPPEDADAALVEQVQGHLLDALAHVDETGRRVPDLRRPLGALAELHTAHLEALDTAGPYDARVQLSRPGVDALRQQEARLQRQLVDAAVEARSGTLAKLLASMAAAVAQHLAVEA